MTFASGSREGFAERKRTAVVLEDDDRDDDPHRDEWDYMVMEDEDEDID